MEQEFYEFVRSLEYAARQSEALSRALCQALAKEMADQKSYIHDPAHYFIIWNQ